MQVRTLVGIRTDRVGDAEDHAEETDGAQPGLTGGDGQNDERETRREGKHTEQDTTATSCAVRVGNHGRRELRVLGGKLRLQLFESAPFLF